MATGFTWFHTRLSKAILLHEVSVRVSTLNNTYTHWFVVNLKLIAEVLCSTCNVHTAELPATLY